MSTTRTFKHRTGGYWPRDLITTHTHFQSTTEFADWALAHVKPSGQYDYLAERALAGAATLRTGSEEHVERARSYLQHVQSHIEVPRLVWESAIVGQLPNVPAFVAGYPEDMYTRTVSLSERSPLRVYIGVSTLASVTEQQIIERGIVIAALGIALSELRPVYLTPWVDLADAYNDQGSIISWDIQTSPLVLGQLMPSLADPQITRYLGIQADRVLHLSRRANEPHPDYRSAEAMRRNLGASPDDLVIPEILPGDPLLNNPLVWLNDQIARYAPTEDY